MKLTETIAKLPVVGSKATLENVAKFKKMRAAVNNVHQDTDHFRDHNWYYDCKELLKIHALVDPEEAADFEFDPRKLNIAKEGAIMMYGI